MNSHPTRHFLYASVAGLVLSAAAVSASAATLTTLSSMSLSCIDFKQNSNGSWTPTHTVTIFSDKGTLKLTPSMKFVLGTPVGGIDIAEILWRECAPR